VSSPAILLTQVTLLTAFLKCNYLKWIPCTPPMKKRHQTTQG
jgi:hypothetical protein